MSGGGGVVGVVLEVATSPTEADTLIRLERDLGHTLLPTITLFHPLLFLFKLDVNPDTKLSLLFNNDSNVHM